MKKLRYDPPTPAQAIAWWNSVVCMLDHGSDDELLRDVLYRHHWPNAEQIERLMGIRLGETVESAKRAIRPLLGKIERRARKAHRSLLDPDGSHGVLAARWTREGAP